MRTLSVLGLTILSLAPLSSFAQSADPAPSQAPGANDPPPVAPPPPPVAVEPAPPPPPAPAPPPPAPAPTTSISSQPPINITITNTNTNTNPVTTTTTNTNTNPHTNTNTSTNTNTNTATATATAAPPAIAAAPIAPTLRPGVFERYTLSAPMRSAPWITLGAIAGDHALGARGSIDLITRGAWALGIAGSITGEGGRGGDGRGGGGGDPDHGQHGDRGGRGGGRGTATVYIARTGSIHGFDVRAQLGAGVAFGDARGNDRGTTDVARTITGDPTAPDGKRRGDGRAAPIAQAALLVGRPLSAHWGIAAGPVLTATGKGAASQDAHSAPVDLTLFAGLRYRL